MIKNSSLTTSSSSALNAVEITQRWLESIVIELNLCPFAKREYLQNRIRLKQSTARNEESLLQDLMAELTLLTRQDDIETSVLILPHVLSEFDDYNQFLALVDTLIQEMAFEGIFQIASFHPHYQFAGTSPDDVENYTNRSPFPLLHILREASLEKAIDQHPNTEKIPDTNIQLMNSLGAVHMQKRLELCRSELGASEQTLINVDPAGSATNNIGKQ